MSLRDATIRPMVTQLSAGRRPAWSAGEIDRICTKLIALSAVVTPHVVDDVTLSDAEMQRYLVARTWSAIGGWLVRAAAEVRRSLQIGSPVRKANGELAMGLRASTTAELEAVANLGHDRATRIARAVTLQPDIRKIADLDAVSGIGPAILSGLHAGAYLDQPRAALASPTLLAFALNPAPETYLAVLDGSDIELVFGDGNTMGRRPPLGGTPFERFIRLLDLAQTDAQRRLTPLSGALASQAKRLLARQELQQRYRNALSATDGALVVDDAYAQAMVNLINAASANVRLAVFLATASTAGAAGTGSLVVIQALEACAAAGKTVKVILDRDRPTDPYHSTQINRPVVDRLRAAGVTVKQDKVETLFHSKFLVTDTSHVIVGSHNLTSSSIARTHEVSVQLDSPAIAGAFAARFDALWAALP
jgi:hypothetical protein